MKYLRQILAYSFLTFTLHLGAQEYNSWETFIQEYSSGDESPSEDWENTYELLCELHEHPININAATREDLEHLPFLTDKQTEDILAYIYSYGQMKTLGELLMIESLDYDTRHKLEYFICIKEVKKSSLPTLTNLFKYGKQEIIETFFLPFYEREGDINGYLGYKYKHSIRYKFNYGKSLKFGLIGAQGAGEPFFSNKNKYGYDYYSYYFFLKDIGKLKTLAIGCYRLSYGMGLVVNSNFSLGKLVSLTSLGKSNNSIVAHSSQSEGNHFNGIATSIEIIHNLTLSTFVSYRKLDATLNNDGSISTILTDGYHRTKNEIEKKDNSESNMIGSNINYSLRGMHIGLTTIYTRLNRTLSPNISSIFRQYYPSGKHFSNTSVNYNYICSRFTLNGETATKDYKAVATINNISVKMSKNLHIMLLQRFYSYKYSSLYSNSFSEGGNVQNESGIYLGANWRPSYNWNVMAYSDYFYFAWPKYQVSQSSYGFDYLISTSYTGKSWNLEARYRIKKRQKDNKSKISVYNIIQQRVKLRAKFQVDKKFSLQTQIDFTDINADNHENGYMISQQISYKSNDWLNINGLFGYFNTDNYDSRISIYERGMLYSLSFPSFYGEGIRYALHSKIDISKFLMVMTKISVTDYFDRNTISSGLQQINKSSMADAELQIKWKF